MIEEDMVHKRDAFYGSKFNAEGSIAMGKQDQGKVNNFIYSINLLLLLLVCNNYCTMRADI